MTVSGNTFVFISYNHRDREWRDRIAASLERVGLGVLDDTALLAGQDWAQELENMRETARAAILIVTANSLGSFTIQSKELPHLVALQKSNGLRLIPVIAKPCLWQKSEVISSIQVFPESGTPLSSAPDKIEAELEMLARQIIRLFEGPTPQPEESASRPSINAPAETPPRQSSMSAASSASRAAPSKSSSGSPSSTSRDQSLAQRVALRFSVSQPSGAYLAMASLISSRQAVIPYDVLAQSGLSDRSDLPVRVVEFAHPDNPEGSARLVVSDSGVNVALLELDLSYDVPPDLFPFEDALPAGTWSSYCIHPQRGRLPVGGRIGGPFAIENHGYITLQLDEPLPNIRDASGAPVISNGQLVGIVALVSNDGSSWYATPISQRVIEKLQTSASGLPRPVNWLSKGDIESFSPAAREIIGRADQMRQERKLRAITIRVLLVSLARQEGGQLAELLRDRNMELNEALRTDDNRNVPLEVMEEAGFPPISPNVRRVLIGAREKARGLRSKTIDESHILFATLEIPDHPLIDNLKKQGITSDKIKFEIVAEPTVKADLLAGVQSDVPAGEDLLDITPEVNALASVLAAKDADPPLALGLFGEWGSGKSFFMNRLESRIRALQDDAQKAGKEDAQSSYCEHIVQITFNAWNYIDTNLWASLATEIFEGLASAVAKRRGTDSQAERTLVLAAASSSPEVLAETERKKAVAEEELKQTQQQLTVLETSQGNIETRLSPAELFRQAYRFAIAQEQVKEPLEKVAEALKVREGIAATGQIKQEILELRGFWSTLIFTLRHGRYVWAWILVFVVLLGVAWALNYLLAQYNVPAIATRAVGVLVTIGGFLGTFAAQARKALEFIKQAQESKQRLIEEKKQEQTAALKKEYEAVKEKVQKANAAVDAASQTVDQINQQLENMRADRKMADYIRQRNESTDYTQHLGIIARVRADFRHLSTLLQDVKTESRQDALKTEAERQALEMKQRQEAIEEKRQKMKEEERRRGLTGERAEGKTEETTEQNAGGVESNKNPTDKEDKLFPRIDRIILYIDDLDRCPEKNVVEVLQAVHLLLAFPLFIVVVGVDPRWLLRSLERHSAVFSAGAEQNGNNGELDEDPLWQSTPMNYLEKIFQIPFTLRPINRTGFGKLVDKFAVSRKINAGIPVMSPAPKDSEKLEAPAIALASAAAGAMAAAGTASQSLPGAGSQSTTIPIQTEKQAAIQQPISTSLEEKTHTAATGQGAAETVIDRNPAHLQIEGWEREFMKTLHELIPSPRAGKRFINIYRLLRASVKDAGRKRFIGSASGGEYQAVQILLAILTGYPAEATEILQNLIEKEHPETWGEFVETLKERVRLEDVDVRSPKTTKAPNLTKQQTRGNGPTAPRQAADAVVLRDQRWTELFDKLDRIGNNLKDMPCASFCNWGTQIARYSFQSGRVMLYQRE
jgi:hypothetical protein